MGDSVKSIEIFLSHVNEDLKRIFEEKINFESDARRWHLEVANKKVTHDYNIVKVLLLQDKIKLAKKKVTNVSLELSNVLVQGEVQNLANSNWN